MKHGSVAKRGLFNVLSQSLNSGGNVLLALAVARVTTASEFGAWSISYVAYIVSLTFTRSISSIPMMLDRVGEDRVAEARIVRGGVSAAAATGVLAAAALFAIGAVFPAGRHTCWAFAVVIPGLLVQDSTRYVFFRARTPGLAAASDALWLVLQVGAFVFLHMQGHESAAVSSLAWGLAGGASAVMSLMLLKTGLSAREALSFSRGHRWVSERLVVDAILVSLSTHALPVVVAVVAGLPAAGALRAAQALMGGMSVVTAGLAPTMTVEAVRSVDAGRSEYALLWRWCLVLAAVATVYGIALLALPDSVGVQLLGTNWWHASPLILALVIQALLRGPFTGVPILLRARHDLNGALRLRAATCIPALLIPATGAYMWGAEGAAWGIALAAAVIDGECLLALRWRHGSQPAVTPA